MIVSGTISILMVSWNSHRWSRPRTTPLHLVPDIISSNCQTFSSTSMQTAPSRTPTLLSRTSLRSRSLVTSPSPAAISSAQNYVDSSYSYLRSISSSTSGYTTWFGTYIASRETIVRDHFRLISSYNSRPTTTPAPAQAPTFTPVRISPNHRIVFQLLIDLSIRSRPALKDLPVQRPLEPPQHQPRFQGRNSYPRSFLLYRQRRRRFSLPTTTVY